MHLLLIRIDRIQQIAAEPATLDALKTALSPHTQPPQTAPELPGSLAAWPLVADPNVPASYVRCSPTKRSA
ncbi:hypothetical protein [Streptomyces tremellae]|uniref:Uncharacterized protein n=1 Tax=Streptomyces tremellae TaxID=1124239 RepID=A0ABP7EE76_9ACTN